MAPTRRRSVSKFDMKKIHYSHEERSKHFSVKRYQNIQQVNGKTINRSIVEKMIDYINVALRERNETPGFTKEDLEQFSRLQIDYYTKDLQDLRIKYCQMESALLHVYLQTNYVPEIAELISQVWSDVKGGNMDDFHPDRNFSNFLAKQVLKTLSRSFNRESFLLDIIPTRLGGNVDIPYEISMMEIICHLKSIRKAICEHESMLLFMYTNCDMKDAKIWKDLSEKIKKTNFFKNTDDLDLRKHYSMFLLKHLETLLNLRDSIYLEDEIVDAALEQ